MGKAKKIIIVLVLIIVAGGAVYTYVPLKDIPYVGGFLDDIVGGSDDDDRSAIRVTSKRIKVTLPENITTTTGAVEPVSEELIEEVVVETPKVAKPTPKPTPKPVVKPKPTPTPKPAATTTSTAKRPAKKPHIINIASFNSKDEALEVKTRLRKGGYNVYRTEFVKDGVKWHRVRIGFYPSRAEATQVSKDVASKYGITGGWVTRPSWSEYDAYAK